MMRNDCVTGSRYAPSIMTKWSKFHPVEKNGRWVFCGCFAPFFIEHRVGIKRNKFLAEIRAIKTLGRYRKRSIPVYQAWPK